jgi:hypothetical protein
MNILEQEIENVVWSAIQANKHEILNERGLPIFNEFSYITQMELSTYGRADIVGLKVWPIKPGEQNRTISVHIFELKKDAIGVNTFLQALRYAKGVTEMITYAFNTIFIFNVHIMLVGKTIEESAFTMASDLLYKIHLFKYRIDLEKGLRFERCPGDSFCDDDFAERDHGELKKVLIHNLMKQYGRTPQPISYEF